MKTQYSSSTWQARDDRDDEMPVWDEQQQIARVKEFGLPDLDSECAPDSDDARDAAYEFVGRFD